MTTVYVAVAYGTKSDTATVYTGPRALRRIASDDGRQLLDTDRYWNGGRAVELHWRGAHGNHDGTTYVHRYQILDVPRFMATLAAWYQRTIVVA